MSEYLTQDFAESLKHQSSSSTNQDSFEATLESMFSTVQRSEIANIVVAAVRSIQMQQFTSSSEPQSIAQTSELIKE
jgi:hypothetical protein